MASEGKLDSDDDGLANVIEDDGDGFYESRKGETDPFWAKSFTQIYTIWGPFRRGLREEDGDDGEFWAHLAELQVYYSKRDYEEHDWAAAGLNYDH